MRWGSVVRIVPLALATCLALSLPASAEDAAGAAGHASAATSPKVGLSIPTVQVVNSSIDETTLRSIFMGDVAGHADELAALKAASIRVPEIRIDYATPEVQGVTETGSVVLRDVRLNKVAKGVAQAIIIGSYETTSSQGATAKFGKISAEDFDIGGLLAFVGLVKGDPTSPRKALYRDLRTNGGTVSGPKADCTLGPSSVMRVSVRPLKVSLVDMFALMKKVGEDKDTKPSKQDIATMVDFFVDIFDAVEVSPVKLGGFACTGIDNDGKPIAIKLGSITAGAFARGRYPDFTVKDLAVDVPGDGSMSLGEFRFKGFDMSGPLATLKAAAGNIDEDWFKANYRALVPAFDGASLAKFAMDIPDPDNPGERFKAQIAKFDLTLKDWINAIPTDVATSASHIVATLPDKTSDRQIQALLDYGIDKFDVGFDLGLNWNEAAQELRLDRFSVTGVDMGSIVAASVIGGATRDLFSADPTVALATSLALTLKRVKVDIKDAGLADIILRAAAEEAHKDAAALRSAVASMTQGTIILFLGSAANSEKVATAVADFIKGKQSLSVTVAAKDPAGVSFDALRAAQDDPTSLLDKVDIDAVAR
ncbi:MAG: hypothetical protein WDM94_07580 [Bauldia sp.]